jgi:DNA-binding SARP family transcriptional activator/tetratricopeptide (TPR) repeat protein
MIEIYLLRSFQLISDETPIAEGAWHTKQARQLLKLLLNQRGKIVSKDQLIEALWPEADPAKAATTLRTAINALRNTLEPDRPPYAPSTYIVARAPGYKFRFTDNIWVDVIAFEALLDQAEQAAQPQHKKALLSQAIALYWDDYLPDDLYADWAYLARERLRERYLNALAQLAEFQAGEGDYERAIASLRRALSRDPGREPVYRALMRYYVLAGNTASALKSFERLRAYLQDELEVEPSPQTVAVYQSILNGQYAWPVATPIAATDTAVSLEAIFIGREQELGNLTHLLAQAREGLGSLVMITGEAGVGKTQLVITLLKVAVAQEMVTLTARCQAVEQSLPYAPIVEALEVYLLQQPGRQFEALSGRDRQLLAQLLPSLAWQVEAAPGQAGLPQENRRLLMNSLVNALRHLAGNGLVLFLDDLQWADEATLTLLSNLTRYLTTTKILLIFAYRAEDALQNQPLNRLLHGLKRHRQHQTTRLDRFSRQEVATYLSKLIPETDLTRAEAQLAIERLHHLTGGNPLFMAETLRAFLDEHPDALKSDALHQLLHDPALEHPSSQVTDIILARLELLSPEARDILEIASVIGRDFSVELLDTVATYDPLPALSLLLQRQFLVETSPARLNFSHHLVQEVIYRQLSSLARQRLHQRIAQVLITLHGSQAGPWTAEIARHSQHAGSTHHFQALKFSVLAGDYAMRTFGFQQAALYYRQALLMEETLAPTPAIEEWLQLAFLGLGMAQESLADWDAAQETYTRLENWAQQRHNTGLGLDAKRRLALMLGLIGQLDQSAALLARVAEQSPSDAPPAVVDMQDRLGLLLPSPVSEPAWQGSGWPSFHLRPIQIAQPWEAIIQVFGQQQAMQLLNLYGWGLTLQGQTTTAEATLYYAAQLAAGYNQPGLQATSYHLIAQLWDGRGDYTRMEAALSQALKLVADMPHLRWAVIWGRIHRAYVDMRWNQLERAQARLKELNLELENRAAFRSHWLSVQVGLGLAAIFRQDVAAAMRYFETVLANSKDLYASNFVVLHLSQARLNRYRQNLGAARENIVRAMAFAGKRGMLADYISAAVEAARFDRATNRPRRTVPLLQQVEDQASRAGLLPGLLSARQALIRAFDQAEQPEEAARFRQLARADRDAIAATIPQPEDRAAYLSRRDLRALGKAESS